MTDYFYRLIDSSEFKHFTQAQKIIPLRCKTFFRPTVSYYSLSDKKWIDISDQKEFITSQNNKTVVQEFVDTPSEPKTFSREDNPVLEYLCFQSEIPFYMEGLELFSRKDFVNFFDFRKQLQITEFKKNNFIDSKLFYKDYSCVIVQTQEEELTLKITIQKYKRSASSFYEDLLKDYDVNPCIEESSIIFNLKDGSVKIENPFEDIGLRPCLINEDYTDDDFLDADHYLKKLCDKRIPESIIKFAFEKFISLAQTFTGIKYDLSHFDQNENLLIIMYKITKLPFEPQLYPILISSALLLKKFKYDRKDPEIFAKFCQKAGICNTKVIRRAYLKRNDTLINYLRLKRCGFKDINYFAQILESDILPDYINSVDTDSFIYFMQFCIDKRGEKPAVTILEKAGKDEFFSRDAMEMFARYHRYIPRSLRDDILEDGLTEFNHNALANISFQCRNKNTVFDYTASQLRLQDEISSYEFLLPQDSYQLCNIGACLHNCVASYVDKIISKKSTIVYVKKGAEYKICIEVAGDKIIQELAAFNKEPDEEAKKILEEWHIRHNLKLE